MTIRSICLIDRIHTDLASYLSSAANTELKANDAAFLFDVTPAVSIEQAADFLFKNHELSSFHYSVDGRGGWLGVKSSLNGELRNAAAEICSVADDEVPETNFIKHLEYRQINHLCEGHVQLQQKARRGAKPKVGDGWLAVDIVPATAALWLTNEIVTSALVEISDVKFNGSSGKIFLIGDSEQLAVARDIMDELGAISE